ncbi:EipB family protein [Marinivivus vitaminiproducens]|uniref:EipB family protein n=1 Tax=Marinivivus vitaminiproducens TaxID=3035935 RepID=UPI00279C09FE|nr:DUF1849 family protein [Geminicoccaceae bacterium SCSIO 64248]
MIRLLVLALLLAVLPSAAAEAAALQPHRASYSLSLDSADATSGIVGVEGGLVIEWARTCDGWTGHQRLAFTTTAADGNRTPFDFRFTSWESYDALRFRFTIENATGGVVDSRFEGEAQLDGDGAAGRAFFRVPEQRQVDLPAGTLFPVRHMQRLLAAAEQGDGMATDRVFDGSSFDALSDVTTLIGPDRQKEDPARGLWPMSMAYHRHATPYEALPDFEVEMELNDTGVMNAVRLNYSDFVLRGALIQVEVLPAPLC